jgi:hypothetical protein
LSRRLRHCASAKFWCCARVRAQGSGFWTNTGSEESVTRAPGESFGVFHLEKEEEVEEEVEEEDKNDDDEDYSELSGEWTMKDCEKDAPLDGEENDGTEEDDAEEGDVNQVERNG